MLRFISNTPFSLKTLFGFVAGVVVALYFGKEALPLFDPIGDTFINLIQMLVVPLIFFTVTSSIARLGQGERDGGHIASKALGLGAHTIALFILTSVLAVGVGFAVGLFFQPGVGSGVLPVQQLNPHTIPSPVEVLTGIIPTNIFSSVAQDKILSIILISILVGSAIASFKGATGTLSTVLEEASKVMFKITRWVIQLTPIGVFGLIGSVVASYGLASLTPLIGFMGCIFLGCLIQLLLVYPALLKIHGLSVSGFYRSIFTAQQTAFFTCSSIATLPVSLETAITKLKLQRTYVGFALPLGATMKMDGCGGIYPAISCIFIANYFGIHLSTTHFVIIALSAVLGSLATAGVPGVAVVMLTLTLSAAGLPLEGIAILAAIDRILDMIRTATNVTGQILVPSLVSKTHGLIEPDSPLIPKR